MECFSYQFLSALSPMLGRFPEVGYEFQKSSKKGFRSPGSVLLLVEWIFLKARGLWLQLNKLSCNHVLFARCLLDLQGTRTESY